MWAQLGPTVWIVTGSEVFSPELPASALGHIHQRFTLFTFKNKVHSHLANTTDACIHLYQPLFLQLIIAVANYYSYVHD